MRTSSLLSVNKLAWTLVVALCCDVILVYKRNDYLGSIKWGTAFWPPSALSSMHPTKAAICNSWGRQVSEVNLTQRLHTSPVLQKQDSPTARVSFLSSTLFRWLVGGASLLYVVKNLFFTQTPENQPSAWEYNEIKTSIYKLLPLRLASKCWGVINDINLPRPLRKPVIGAFAWYTSCDVSEAAVDDLQEYPNLSEFFRRTLKPGLRPICEGDCVVSPSDGKILNFGEVVEGFVEQVKGICYTLQTFLGPHPWADEGSDQFTDEHEYHRQLLTNKDGSTALYHCVVYLAPGDYHRFHSPADWTVLRRRHFPGKLLSVKPRVASWVKGLFNINERVVYCGEWEHGFFSMTAVGATNVGSIKCTFDETLATNRFLYKKNTWCDLNFKDQKIEVKKGDEFGEFNMGSTMVMIFEAPKNFKWHTTQGGKVKYGEIIAGLP